MASAPSRDASSSGVLTRVCEKRIQTMLKVLHCLVQKGIILTAWFKKEVGGHLAHKTRTNM